MGIGFVVAGLILAGIGFWLKRRMPSQAQPVSFRTSEPPLRGLADLLVIVLIIVGFSAVGVGLFFFTL